MKKDEIIDFMSKDDIEILNSIPTKSVFSRKLSKKILKPVYHWFYDWKSLLPCSRVASVSLYIEAHRNGVELIFYTSQPSKIIELIGKVGEQNISTENCV